MKTNLHIFFIGLLLLFSSHVLGQVSPPFTVLRTNMDTSNRQLYVELMYARPACSDYQARFRLDTKGGMGDFVRVDSFLNNAQTFDNVGDSVLQRPRAGGYQLRFRLPSGVSVQDSPHICVVSQVIPYECVGCGAGGSDALFTSLDVDSSCPYLGDDLLACHPRRVGDTHTWEGWIRDPRDCQPYRMVLMPDGCWWFAQNLNYQKDLNYQTLQSSSNLHTTVSRGEFLCPQGYNVSSANTGGNPTVAVTNNTGGGTYNYSKDNSTVSTSSCANYGALYTWHTAMALNGRTSIYTPTPTDALSEVRGICPDGWYLPGLLDWSRLINQESYNLFKLTRKYKGLISCPPHSSAVDSVCATYNNPAWAWRRADYGGKISAPFVLGQDNYGFGLLPNGYIYGHATATSRYYHRFGLGAYLWLSSETGSDGYDGVLDYDGLLSISNMQKNNAAGVRCISSNPNISSLSHLTYDDSSMELLVKRPVPGATYTWGVTSKDIPNIASRFAILNNGTTVAHTTTATVSGFTMADTGKVFTLHVTMDMGSQKLFHTRDITISEITIDTTFDYTGSPQEIRVPPGRYRIEVWGAEGGTGNSYSGAGGKGGYAAGIYVASTSTTVYVYVGGKPVDPGNTAWTGGWNGGGGTPAANNSYEGAAGGGATDVRVGGTALVNRIIVAGGGGGGGNGAGGGSPVGGAGGGTTGVAGGVVGSGAGGGGGAQSSGGAAGSYGSGYGAAGSLGNGGAGNYYDGANYPGGGGGGGYYGGGGSAINGGGGGSGYIGGVVSGSMSNGVRSGHGLARITRID